MYFTSSDLLFNKMFPLHEGIPNFSLTHVYHFLVAVLEGAHFLIISQVIFEVNWLLFIAQKSLGSSSLFSDCSRLTDFVWLLNLCLKSVSSVPMHSFSL